MDEFFSTCIETYDDGDIWCKRVLSFYCFFAPKEKDAKILDPGCGIGLELGEY